MVCNLHGTGITTSNEAGHKEQSAISILTRKWVAPFIGFCSITASAELPSRIDYLNTGNTLMRDSL